MELTTMVILKSQFHNIWEGQKLAWLIYKAIYTGDDTLYQETYSEELVREISQQTDFWDCVNRYNESYSVQVTICGNHDHIANNKQLKEHLTSLVLVNMKARSGKNPGESFLDNMDKKELEDLEKGILHFKRSHPDFFR